VKAVLVKQLFLESGFIVEISVIDNGIGQGVTFTLKLPLRVDGQRHLSRRRVGCLCSMKVASRH
jgi:hypothetical protein